MLPPLSASAMQGDKHLHAQCLQLLNKPSHEVIISTSHLPISALGLAVLSHPSVLVAISTATTSTLILDHCTLKSDRLQHYFSSTIGLLNYHHVSLHGTAFVTMAGERVSIADLWPPVKTSMARLQSLDLSATKLTAADLAAMPLADHNLTTLRIADNPELFMGNTVADLMHGIPASLTTLDLHGCGANRWDVLDHWPTELTKVVLDDETLYSADHDHSQDEENQEEDNDDDWDECQTQYVESGYFNRRQPSLLRARSFKERW